MNRFPYNDSAEFPLVWLCNLHEGSRPVELMSTNSDRAYRHPVGRLLPFFKFCCGRVVCSFSSLHPWNISGLKTACRFSDAPSVRNAETMLGAEFSSANISRFEIKDCSAFLTRFFHGFILACQKLHCALYLRMFVDSVIYCQRAEREIDIPTLFELTDPEQGAEASA